MPLLTFDQFEAAVPELLAEASAAREDLHPVGRFGEEGVLKPLGAAMIALARLVPYIDCPLEPGAYYITPEGEPPRRGDVRAEALAALAQILEASVAIRSTMTVENARGRSDGADRRIAEQAFSIFAAPGGMPVESLEWSLALEELGVALTFIQNPRLGPEIGPAGAHDALDSAAAHVVCVLALIDAQRAQANR